MSPTSVRFYVIQSKIILFSRSRVIKKYTFLNLNKHKNIQSFDKILQSGNHIRNQVTCRKILRLFTLKLWRTLQAVGSSPKLRTVYYTWRTIKFSLMKSFLTFMNYVQSSRVIRETTTHLTVDIRFNELRNCDCLLL